MMIVQISPRFTSEYLLDDSIEKKIDVHEDRIKGWLFDQARFLLKNQYSGIAILQLALSYFEGYWMFIEGTDNGGSKDFFEKAFRDVFPNRVSEATIEGAALQKALGQLPSDLYVEGRCGLFHDGMIRRKVFLGSRERSITLDVDKKSGEIYRITIDPEKFLGDIEVHFQRYIQSVRNPINKQLRGNFEALWKLKYSPQIIKVAS